MFAHLFRRRGVSGLGYVLAASLAVRGAGSVAGATDYTGDSGGDWTQATNWSGGAVPNGNVDVTLSGKNVVLKSPQFYSRWVWIEVPPPGEGYWQLQQGYEPQQFEISSLIASGGDLRLQAQSPANVGEWPGLTVNGMLSLTNASVTVNQGTLTANGPMQFSGATISADTGGVVTLSAVSSISQRNWSMAAHSGASIHLAALTGIAGGSEAVSLSATDSGSLVEAPVLPVLPNVALSAYAGGTINLPEVTVASGNQATSNGTVWRAAGGTISLPKLATLAQRGIAIEATGNGVVDVHALASASGDGSLTMYASSGGTIRTGMLTNIQFLQVEAGGNIDAAGAGSIEFSFIRVRDAASTLSAPNATSMHHATLQVYADGTLSLPGITSLPQRECTVTASSGGTVSFAGLASIASGTATVSFSASDAGSSISAPSLAALPNVNLEVNSGGSIAIAAATTAEGNEQPYASLFWRASAATLDVRNVGSITKRGLVIEALAGGEVDVRGLTAVSTSGTGIMNVHAAGTGSLVRMGTLSGFDWIHAENGGTIDASMGPTVLTTGAINIDHGTLKAGSLSLQGGYMGQNGGTLTGGAVTISATSSLNQFSGDASVGNIVSAGAILAGGTLSAGNVDAVASGADSVSWSSAGHIQVGAGGVLSVSRLRQLSVTIHGTTEAGGTLRLAESVPGASTGTPSGDDAMVSVVRNLSIASDGAAGFLGTLDLMNNDLIVDYLDTGISPRSAIEAMVRAGYNGGDWQGKGITSSVAAGNAGSYALVVLDNAERATPFVTFDGVAVSNLVVIVKFSWVADLDLDGVVTSNDAIVFANNYSEGSVATHRVGDLNYNGVFDSNDAILFANAYNESLPHLPEPVSLGFISIGAGGLLIRRRRAPRMSEC